MNELNFQPWAIVTSEIAIRWSLALLHFLWQGTLVGGIVYVASQSLRHRSASLRYAVHATGLLALPICVVITFSLISVPRGLVKHSPVIAEAAENIRTTSIEASQPNVEKPIVEAPEPAAIQSAADVIKRQENNRATAAIAHPIPVEQTRFTPETIATIIGWSITAYLVGVTCFFVRLGMALWGSQRIRRESQPFVDASLLKMIAEQSRKVGLRFVPIVAFCERVAVPTVVGILKPMVLLPASVLTSLSTDEFAAIIAHELAHIRRYDLWMNLVQRAVESLLFFHPVVWYISRQLSSERELCCDDLVVSIGNNRLSYAGALLHMAELCAHVNPTASTALAASGANPSLLEHRIERLIASTKPPRLQLTRMGFLAVFATVSGLGLVSSMFASLPNDERPSETIIANNLAPEDPASEDAATEAVQTISGTVLGPIAGVNITAIFEKWPSSGEPATYTRLSEVKVQSDADGNYQVAVPEAYQAMDNLLVTFTYEIADYLPRAIERVKVQDFRLGAGAGRGVGLVQRTILKKGKRLIGRVLLPDGSPAAEALVATNSKYRAYSWKFHKDDDYTASSFTKSDADGKFELLTDPVATLFIQHQGHAPIVIDDLYGPQVVEPSNLVEEVNSVTTFLLSEGVRPRGIVRGVDGRPIPGAIVAVHRAFQYDEFHMPLAFSFSQAANERGEFELPPLPPDTYRVSVGGRAHRISEYNKNASESCPVPMLVTFTQDWRALHPPRPLAKVLQLDEVFIDQTWSLEKSQATPTFELQAVETVHIAAQVTQQDEHLLDNESRIDATIHGRVDGQPWNGRSQSASENGIVKLIAPKGATDVVVGTGQTFHRRQKDGPLEIGDAIHLGTVQEDIDGLEIIRPKMATLQVHLKLPPEVEQAANFGNEPIHFQAYYVRPGYRENNPSPAQVYVASARQVGTSEFSVSALPNEEFVLKITKGNASNQIELHETRVTLEPGEILERTIDLTKPIASNTSDAAVPTAVAVKTIAADIMATLAASGRVYMLQECDKTPSALVDSHPGYRILLWTVGGQSSIGALQPQSPIAEVSKRLGDSYDWSGGWEGREYLELVLFKSSEEDPAINLTNRNFFKSGGPRGKVQDLFLGHDQGFHWYIRGPIDICLTLQQQRGMQSNEVLSKLLAIMTYPRNSPPPEDVNTAAAFLQQYEDVAVSAIEKDMASWRADDEHRQIVALSGIRTNAATQLLLKLFESDNQADQRNAAYALIHKPFRKEASAAYVGMLEKNLNVEAASEACVELGLVEALPALKSRLTKPSGIRELRTVFAAKRNLEGKPIPVELLEASQVLLRSQKQEPVDEGSAVGVALKQLQESSDHEAAVVLALELGSYTMKGDVRHIQDRGFAILQERKDADSIMFSSGVLNSLPESVSNQILQLASDVSRAPTVSDVPLTETVTQTPVRPKKEIPSGPRKLVATIFGTTVYLDELGADENDLQQQGESLLRFISSRAIEDYVRREKIEMTEDMKDKLKEVVQTTVLTPIPNSTLSDGQQRAGLHAMMYGSLMDWLICKSLYERYGGRVGMGSLGLWIAVDGRNELMREYIQSGRIEIKDKELEKAFWKAANRPNFADAYPKGEELKRMMENPPMFTTKQPESQVVAK